MGRWLWLGPIQEEKLEKYSAQRRDGRIPAVGELALPLEASDDEFDTVGLSVGNSNCV